MGLFRSTHARFLLVASIGVLVGLLWIDSVRQDVARKTKSEIEVGRSRIVYRIYMRIMTDLQQWSRVSLHIDNDGIWHAVTTECRRSGGEKHTVQSCFDRLKKQISRLQRQTSKLKTQNKRLQQKLNAFTEPTGTAEYSDGSIMYSQHDILKRLVFWTRQAVLNDSYMTQTAWKTSTLDGQRLELLTREMGRAALKNWRHVRRFLCKALIRTGTDRKGGKLWTWSDLEGLKCGDVGNEIKLTPTMYYEPHTNRRASEKATVIRDRPPHALSSKQ